MFLLQGDGVTFSNQNPKNMSVLLIETFFEGLKINIRSRDKIHHGRGLLCCFAKFGMVTVKSSAVCMEMYRDPRISLLHNQISTQLPNAACRNFAPNMDP